MPDSPGDGDMGHRERVGGYSARDLCGPRRGNVPASLTVTIYGNVAWSGAGAMTPAAR